MVADMFSKYLLVRKLPNSTSTAVCIELFIIFTELGLPHTIWSDNGPCYISKEFQQFLQHYSMHQTGSTNHPRSNGFAERMVGVTKKLMDKARKEGKPWISGLFDYRVTPQASSIALPLQLMTQCMPREKHQLQLPSALGAPNTGAHQEARKQQAWKGVSGATPRYTSLDATQATCNMGTCSSGKPNRCTKFLLNNARKW